MVQWVDHHGIAFTFICFVFACIMSSAPKQIPTKWGFWKLWMFNAAQALGANAGKYANSNPDLKNLQATEVSTNDKGDKIETDTKITKLTAVPEGSSTIPKA
jgi:hypothetical protein